jgi:uncharacterized membrane protein
MEKNRLEALGDGVLAIIITIMVLEMKVPNGSDVEALKPVLPIFLSYVLSFIYLGIYWNNHHHLLKACRRVNAGIMWANLYLLFWFSLFPFVTGWLGENHFTSVPSALYGAVLLLAATLSSPYPSGKIGRANSHLCFTPSPLRFRFSSRGFRAVSTRVLR